MRCTRTRQLFQSYLLTSKSEKCGMSTSKSIVTKDMVTEEKFLEWEIVKIRNKQVMYEELGSAAPQSVITCSRLSWDDISGKHLQRHFAFSRGRTCLSRSLTRDFLLIRPYGNKEHFINKTKKLGRNEGWVPLGRFWQFAEEAVGSLSYSISPHPPSLLQQMASAWWTVWEVRIELSGHEWHKNPDVSYPNCRE